MTDPKEQQIRKHSLLIPVAVATGTLIAVGLYAIMPSDLALFTIIAGAILAGSFTYRYVRSQKT
ncbi:MAG: hypothetical protein A4E24_01819 [Methanomethylovorans sp. PtaU1.Bin093]|jgi:hypothetical protein|nr:hypothetical protein [Methanomethylovorans sp. PtaU1.Bin093]OPY18632.1 MAG: hypothetical protein A4E24_01819 [Methanomethylovorans sp. PtaU1.Bin093]